MIGPWTRTSKTERGAVFGGSDGFTVGRDEFTESRRAFTLIEIVIVLLVIGILTVAAAPKIAFSLRQHNVDAAAKKIVADLEMARRFAKSTGASRTVQFDVAANQYTLPSVMDINHPVIQLVTKLSNTGYAATLVSASFNSTSQLTFDRYGRPFAGSPLVPLTAGSIVIKSGTVQRTIAVNPTTGKAQIQ